MIFTVLGNGALKITQVSYDPHDGPSLTRPLTSGP